MRPARRVLAAAAAALLAVTLGLGPVHADETDTSEPTGLTAGTTSPAAAAPVDVYTTPGEHVVNGRRWNTVCTAYSSTVDRCSTDIWATVTTWNGSTFTQSTGWVFNNLTYLASPRANWLGNPLATTGEHFVAGRRWKTECDTAWTGTGGCRSQIWATVPEPAGTGWRVVNKWVFNNIVNFSAPPAAGPAPAGPTPPVGAVPTISDVRHPGHATPALYRLVAPIEVTGSVQGAARGTVVTVQLRDATGRAWSTTHATTDASGAWSAELESSFTGWAQIHAHLAGGNSDSHVTSIGAPTVSVSGTTQIDPLASTEITGTVTPAIAGVVVMPQVWAHGTWTGLGSVRTGTDGTFRFPYEYGVGHLGDASVRVRAATPSGQWTSTTTAVVSRMRWANTVIAPTTAGEVQYTWRAGCPVGISNLSTIRINHLGLDGLVHRGEIIVRRDLASSVADVFERSLASGFPIGQMRNPDGWKGSDPAMMAANNTSAFNCRQVVGNPSALSPHARGIAVDINPWQNPYRDPSGKWWPSTAHVRRTPVVPGQLTSSSTPVQAFTGHGWSWFSGWDWHHFEYRGSRAAAASTTTASPATSGALTADDLPRPNGWNGLVADGSPDEGWTGNGTWTHAVDPHVKSADLFALGCVEHPAVSPPLAALEGTLADGDRPGVTVALEFATTGEATAWLEAWQSASRACSDVMVTTDGPTGWAAVRGLADGTWRETAEASGDVVTLTMLRD